MKQPAYMGFIFILRYVLVFLLSSLSSFRVVSSVSFSISTDKEALLSFKSDLSKSSAETLSSWLVNDSSPCNWTGVFCSESSDRIVGLDLSGLRLAGTISPHIGNLSFLSSLELQDNLLTGTIPDQVGNLLRLNVLNMSSNHIGGAIPLNITMCSALKILDLMENEITGTIPAEISKLRNLEILKLGRNKLAGNIPPSISNLSSLDTLNLGTNNLGGGIPGDLDRLQNLKYLDLTINHLEGTIPSSVYNISSLVNLAVASNNLWGEIPSDIGDKLPNLLVFNFCINKFTGAIPGSLHNLTNINVIRMAHNLLEGSVPPGLGNLPHLRMYNIGYNRIRSSGDQGLDYIISSLANSTQLNFLAIDGNFLEGVIPENIGDLSTSLTYLYMGQNRISGGIPASIRYLSSLALLNLSHNHISGEIPPEIGELAELQELFLANNNISGRIPNSLGNLRQLSQIDLSSNDLVGVIPSAFSNLQRLLSMDLSNNRLNGSIAKDILGLPSLSTLLNLSKNSLTGPLPEEVGELEGVFTIDLSHNHISGSIPESISKCKSLQELFMANNNFTGSIPDTLSEVRGLEILDLSRNQLTGSIPSSLEELQALQLLNLSFNNLEGVVPSGGIFQNHSRVHIEGNSKLCLNQTCGKGRGKIFYVAITITIVSATVLCLTIGLLAYLKRIKAKKSQIRLDSFKVLHEVISYDELRMATENFSERNLVGKGSFGSIYKGHLIEGAAVAIKVLDIQRNGSWKSFLAECEALRNVRHRNLVKLITLCSSLDFKNVDFLALVYDFMCNGSLEDWLKGRRRHPSGLGLSLSERLKIAIDVASAMDYLHHDSETPIAHCDLKPSNVLLDKDMTAKVGDFGLARLLRDSAADQHSITPTDGIRGSIGYIPPG